MSSDGGSVGGRKRRRAVRTNAPNPAAQHESQPAGQKRRKRFLWTDDLHRRFTCAIFDHGMKVCMIAAFRRLSLHSALFCRCFTARDVQACTPKILFELMQPVPDNMTSDHIKSHLQKYRANSQSSRDEFLADYDRALQEATSKAQAAEATGQVVFPPGFSTFPFSMRPAAQASWPNSLPATNPPSSWFVETQGDELEAPGHGSAQIPQHHATMHSATSHPVQARVHHSHHHTSSYSQQAPYKDIHQPVPAYGSLGRLAALQAAALGVGNPPPVHSIPTATAPSVANKSEMRHYSPPVVAGSSSLQTSGAGNGGAMYQQPRGALPRSASAPALEPPVDQNLAPLLDPLHALQRGGRPGLSPEGSPSAVHGTSAGLRSGVMLAAVAQMRSSMRMHRQMTSASSVNISKYSGAVDAMEQGGGRGGSAPPVPGGSMAQLTATAAPASASMGAATHHVSEHAITRRELSGSAPPGSTAGSVLGITRNGRDELSTGGGDLLPDGMSDFGSLGSLDVCEGPLSLLHSTKVQASSLHDVDPFAFLPRR